MAVIPFLNPLLIEPAVRAALDEDLGRAGDITTLATIPADTRATAVLAARDPGVVAGLSLAEAAFRIVDPGLRLTVERQDGDTVQPGQVIATIDGSARSILTAERVGLNFMGRLCGIATATAQLAGLIAHTKAKVCCTRKTTPGLRAFEKYAVRCGGGSNHRYGLDDAVLIKDNHIAVAGGIGPVLRRVKAQVGHLVKIEIEVDTLDQLTEVLREGADVVLLDNMEPDRLRKAVRLVDGHMVLEASGRITRDTIVAIAETGVDLISSGALTHSSRVLDLGLDIVVRSP